mgnify:CR=1 FL=1
MDNIGFVFFFNIFILSYRILLDFSEGLYWWTGIKIILLRRTIKESGWEKIDTIEVATIMKNPAIRIKLTDGSEIHLDKRKSIIKIIEKYSQKKITK